MRRKRQCQLYGGPSILQRLQWRKNPPFSWSA